MKRKFISMEVETDYTNAEVKKAAFSSATTRFKVIQVQVNAIRKETSKRKKR